MDGEGHQSSRCPRSGVPRSRSPPRPVPRSRERPHRRSQPGEVVWVPVIVPNETAQITVTRKDSGASRVISFELIDLNGDWEGSLVITNIVLSPEAQAEFDKLAEDPPEELEGCDLSSIEAALQQLKGKKCPMTLDIATQEGGTGTASLLIDFSALGSFPPSPRRRGRYPSPGALIGSPSRRPMRARLRPSRERLRRAAMTTS